MVRFILVEETAEYAVYWYYPEGKMQEPHGVITLFKEAGTIEITELAPADFSRQVSLEEVKALRDSVNNMRIEQGEPELTEEEWATPTSGFVSTFYADHVISRIRKSFEQDIILKKGGAAWY